MALLQLICVDDSYAMAEAKQLTKDGASIGVAIDEFRKALVGELSLEHLLVLRAQYAAIEYDPMYPPAFLWRNMTKYIDHYKECGELLSYDTVYLDFMARLPRDKGQLLEDLEIQKWDFKKKGEKDMLADLQTVYKKAVTRASSPGIIMMKGHPTTTPTTTASTLTTPAVTSLASTDTSTMVIAAMERLFATHFPHSVPPVPTVATSTNCRYRFQEMHSLWQAWTHYRWMFWSKPNFAGCVPCEEGCQISC
jgi:hypothetical protein